MILLRKIASLSCLLLLVLSSQCHAQQAATLLQQGWQSLVRDNDTEAMRSFGDAYLLAQRQNDTANKAQALLYMGMCYYGFSLNEGLQYAYRSMEEYRKLEKAHPLQALEGKSRCLQLISTIQSRQGRYTEAIALSKEAIKGFETGKDTMGYLGLVYNSLGSNYKRLNQTDSSIYFHRLALSEHLHHHNTTYLPTALIKVAAIEMDRHNSDLSWTLYNQALHLADSTGNRQAQAAALLGMGEWQWTIVKDPKETFSYYRRSGDISATLNDKSFALQVAEHLLTFYHQTGNYEAAISYKDTISIIQDSIYSWDRRKQLKSLEIQYDVAEKDRRLKLVQKEQEITRLTNYLLWGGIGVLLLTGGAIIWLLLRNRKRDHLLLKTKEALVQATEIQRQLLEEQKRLEQLHMRQQIEYKESQLSAMTLQMLQKNELMQELKARVEEDRTMEKDLKLSKIISKGLNQDQEWSDFNTNFESINQHFYTRLKQAYPSISPNDLKICALIKLNLSIKEMAAVLNISPDSVKTARYRLRKKLQLSTEDNLTEFILSL